MAKNPKYDGYQRGLASMVYAFVDKMSSSDAIETKSCQTSVVQA